MKRQKKKGFWNGFIAFFLLISLIVGAFATLYANLPSFQTIVKDYIKVTERVEVPVPVETVVPVEVEKTTIYLVNKGVVTTVEPIEGKIILPIINDTTFLGWYNGDNIVSNDIVYIKSTVLVAKYKQEEVQKETVVLFMDPYTNEPSVSVYSGNEYVFDNNPSSYFSESDLKYFEQIGYEIVGFENYVNNVKTNQTVVQIEDNMVIKIVPIIQQIKLSVTILEQRQTENETLQIYHNLQIVKNGTIENWFNNYVNEQKQINPNYETFFNDFKPIIENETIVFQSFIIIPTKSYSFVVHFVDEKGEEIGLFSENLSEDNFASVNYFDASSWVSAEFETVAVFNEIEQINIVDTSFFETNVITQNYEFWVVCKQKEVTQDYTLLIHYVYEYIDKTTVYDRTITFNGDYLIDKNDIKNFVQQNGSESAYSAIGYYNNSDMLQTLGSSYFNAIKTGNEELWVRVAVTYQTVTLDLTEVSNQETVSIIIGFETKEYNGGNVYEIKVIKLDNIQMIYNETNYIVNSYDVAPTGIDDTIDNKVFYLIIRNDFRIQLVQRI